MAFFPYTKNTIAGPVGYSPTNSRTVFLGALVLSGASKCLSRSSCTSQGVAVSTCPTTWWIWWLASMTSCWAGKSTKITKNYLGTNIYDISPTSRHSWNGFFSVSQGGICDRFLEAFWQVDAGDMEFLGCKGQIQGKQQALNLFPYHPWDWYVYLHLVGWFLWQMWVNIPYLHGSYGIIYKMLQSKITTTTANSIKNSNLISGPKKSFHWLCTL